MNIDIQLFLPIQLVLSMNRNSPVRKLIVSINQCLINLYLQFTIRFKISSMMQRVVCFAAIWDNPLKSQAKKYQVFPCIPIFNNF